MKQKPESASDPTNATPDTPATADQQMLVYPVPDIEHTRILELNAEMAACQARLHEHLLLLTKRLQIPDGKYVVFAPDFKTIIVT